MTTIKNRNGGNKMLQIENIKLALEEDEALLPRKAAAALGVPASEIGEIRVLRKAIDAREGVRFVYTLQAAVKNQDKVLRRRRTRGVFPATEAVYRLPWWWARGPVSSSAPWPWPGSVRRTSCWSGGGTWSGGRRT